MWNHRSSASPGPLPHYLNITIINNIHGAQGTAVNMTLDVRRYCDLQPHCYCPIALLTSNTAPTYPHMTGVAVYHMLNYNETVCFITKPLFLVLKALVLTLKAPVHLLKALVLITMALFPIFEPLVLFQAAVPKGQCPVGHRGEFPYLLSNYP